jgi:hypothetical protein
MNFKGKKDQQEKGKKREKKKNAREKQALE